MPISLRGFLLCFVGLCIAFVPVLFYAGILVCIEPASALMLEVVRLGFGRISWLIGIHISVYIGLFIALGALVYVLDSLLPWMFLRVLLLCIVLVLPVLSSFARILTYGSIQGRGGTYTFWEAVHRYIEKRR